jgi:hypothetical protein
MFVGYAFWPGAIAPDSVMTRLASGEAWFVVKRDLSPRQVTAEFNLGEMPRTFDLPMLINKVMAFTQLTSAKNCDFI